jgi:hypothetical protein
VVPLDTPLFNEDVSMQGCDHLYGSPLGHKTHAVDEHGAILDDKVTFIPERDEHIETPHMVVRIDSDCEKVETLVPVSLHGLQTEHIMGKGESDCEKVQGLVLARSHGAGLSLETNTLKK